MLEQSARGVAEMWMKHDCVASELEALGNSPVGTPFKMAVAVHLEGRHLASFIEHNPKGLFGLMMDTTSEYFFCLLAACIGSTSCIFEDALVKRRIQDCLKSFEQDCRVGKITHHLLHWHGLTAILNCDMNSIPEGALTYYRQLASQAFESNKFDLPYLLHRDLVMRGKEVDRERKSQFALDSCAYKSEFC